MSTALKTTYDEFYDERSVEDVDALERAIETLGPVLANLRDYGVEDEANQLDDLLTDYIKEVITLKSSEVYIFTKDAMDARWS